MTDPTPSPPAPSPEDPNGARGELTCPRPSPRHATRRACIQPPRWASVIALISGAGFLVLVLSASGSVLLTYPIGLIGILPVAAILIYYFVNATSHAAPPTKTSDSTEKGPRSLATARPDKERSTAERLREIEALRAERLINDEEYFQRRDQLVARSRLLERRPASN